MGWSEIKKSINSTVGTSDFKPLDKIIEDGIGDLRTEAFDTFSIKANVAMRVPLQANRNLEHSHDYAFLVGSSDINNQSIGDCIGICGRILIPIQSGSSGESEFPFDFTAFFPSATRGENTSRNAFVQQHRADVSLGNVGGASFEMSVGVQKLSSGEIIVFFDNPKIVYLFLVEGSYLEQRSQEFSIFSSPLSTTISLIFR